MQKVIIVPLILLFSFIITDFKAQIASTSDNLLAQPIADRMVPFDITDPGISKTIEFGPDLAWADENNFRRVINFMGLDQVDIVRASFQPTYPLVNGTDLTTEQLTDFNYRLNLINTYVGPNSNLALNCDHPWVDAWYKGYPARWEQLIQVTAQAFKDAGHNIVSVGAFNEPDYGWGQYDDAQDMYDITELLAANANFSGVRLSGGNTLNCSEAQGWYDFLVPAGVNEGNTHQLAGSFADFASFYQTVRANGHHATGDELHNIVEALAGYEYGMQTGIWWADVDLASGEMVKAFDGQRIGYAEHRGNWTVAAIYRTPEGKVQAFGGTSERQAVTTTFDFISKNQVVYFDGHGPYRSFLLEMPGGTGYGTGQTNAERVINITWGDDIQPVINGEYVLVNRNSGKVMEVEGGSTTNGANISQNSYSGAGSQHWSITPVDSRIGGDFSYYKILNSGTGKSPDLWEWSLENGGNIATYSAGNGANQQWYFEYVEDGWFYIRSRWSSHCLEVADASTTDGGNVQQMEKTNSFNQQWRLLPVDAPIEFTPPSVPTNLTAMANPVSIKLDWTASPETDVATYTIFRAESTSGPYNTIARDVSVTSFIDNTVVSGVEYFYTVKAVDNSLNRSDYSNQVSATASGDNDLVAHYTFTENIKDSSINLNHCALYGSISFDQIGVGGSSAVLNGTDAFLQLPTDIANHQEITITTWVYWNGGGLKQSIFDFGNNASENMFLRTNDGTSKMQFTIMNGSSEQSLYTSVLPIGEWSHLSVTISASEIRLYVNGEEVAQTTTAGISPIDFKPVLNFIGENQNGFALFNGKIDDFRVYNYALTPEEIGDLANAEIITVTTDVINIESLEQVRIFPNPVSDILNITTVIENQELTANILDMTGKELLSVLLKSKENQLNISTLKPGFYVVKLKNKTGVISSHKILKSR